MERKLASLIINSGLDAGTHWMILEDGNIKIEWNGKTYIVKAEEVKPVGDDEVITIAAHNFENGEVMSVTCPKKIAIESIARAVLQRKDFSESKDVRYYADGELKTLIDSNIYNEIMSAIIEIS